MGKILSLEERDLRREKRKKSLRIIFAIIGSAFVILVLVILVIRGVYGINIYKNTEVKPAYTEVITEDYLAIKELELDVKAISFSVERGGDNISLTHHEFIDTVIEDDELIIREKKRHWYNRVEGKVVLKIPDNFNFEEVVIEGGAGKIKLKDLNMKMLDIEFGAGTMELNNVVVSENASIEGGTGAATIKRGSYNNLDLNMAVGKLELFTSLTGKNIIETGIGSSSVKLIGSSDIYTIKVDKGLGDVIVGGYISRNGDKYGHGPVKISVVGGIGNSVVKFVDENGKMTEDLYK